MLLVAAGTNCLMGIFLKLRVSSTLLGWALNFNPQKMTRRTHLEGKNTRSYPIYKGEESILSDNRIQLGVLLAALTALGLGAHAYFNDLEPPSKMDKQEVIDDGTPE